MKSISRLAVSAVVVLPLAACGGQSEDPSAEASELQTVTVVHPYATPSAGSAGDALDAVGIKYGYFEEEGIEIEPEYADGSTAAIQLIASGAADTGSVELGAAMNGHSTGVPLAVVGSDVINWPWKMATVAGSDITEPEDVEGKTIGIISLASGSYTYTKGFLAEVGLTEDDVELIPVGTGPSAIDAIVKNKVDVLALYDSAYEQMLLADPGLKLDYLDNPALFEDVLSLVHTVTRESLDERSDLIEKYLRARTKTLIFAAVNPEAAALAAWELNPGLLGDSTAEELLPGAADSIAAFVASATPTTGEPSSWEDWKAGSLTEEQWSATSTYLSSAGLVEDPVGMDELFDDRFVEPMNDYDFAEVIETAQNAPREP